MRLDVLHGDTEALYMLSTKKTSLMAKIKRSPVEHKLRLVSIFFCVRPNAYPSAYADRTSWIRCAA